MTLTLPELTLGAMLIFIVGFILGFGKGVSVE